MHDYVRSENPKAANRILDEIVAAAELLGKHPRLGRTGRVAGTRELVISGTPFLLMYRIKGEAVQILAVLHAKRSWPTLF
ncbi:plasmid stabilization system [Candidatus Koribacter versatilis Ellin345]|uniref:Plasmid stabilization system n=1 Tax=Koribacter versatilis (strain Ellin345) TaxID=204669 RepID=Q1IH72_KORVE|nr:plasmid stabilization system [Candidatus Koribacter versatilis Ellin345]